MRRNFPVRVKVAAFERAAGHCEGCGARLTVGRFHYDHDVPDALGGAPTVENCKVLCHACHGVKTAGEDVPRIAKAKRQHRNHIGARVSKTPLPCGRRSKLKRKLNGQVVIRD